MKLKYAKFIGLIGVCRASGRKEIFIDFTKCKNNIILIMGENGSGKSTIINALHPFPDSASDYLSHEEGYKEICYTMPDGTEYISVIDYPINKMGERIQTKAYLTKIVNGVPNQLNPNGNIGSYKDLLYSEFSLDANFLSLSKLSYENKGLVEKGPSDRKKFMASGSLIDSIEVYNKIYKTLNKRSSIFKSMINSIVSKIDSIGDEENIKANMISLDNRINRLEDQKSILIKQLAEAESIVKHTDPNGELQQKYNYLSDQNVSIKANIETIDLFLNKIKSNSDEEHYEKISSYEKCVDYEKYINDQITRLSYDIESISKDIHDLLTRRQEQSESINLKINRVNSLKSEHSYDNLINDIESTKKNINLYLNIFKSMGVSPNTTITKDEFIIGINVLKQIKEQVDTIRSYNYESRLESAIRYTIDNVNVMEKSDNVEKEIDSLKNQERLLLLDLNQYQRLYEKTLILNDRPDDCILDGCSFIKDALEAKKQNPKQKIDEINDQVEVISKRIDLLDKELNSYTEISKLMYSLQIINRSINNNKVILDKLPNGDIFSNKDKFFDLLLRGSTFNEIYDLYKYADQANVFELYKRDVEYLKSLESEYKIYESKKIMIDDIQKDIDEITKNISNITDTITDDNQKLLDKKKVLENTRSLLQITKDTKDKFFSKMELEKKYNSNVDELVSISDKMSSIEIAIKNVNNINQQLLNINNELDPIKNERDSIKFSLDKLIEYNAELDMYKGKYDTIELIKKYSSPTKGGIQNLFIEVYFGQTLKLANQLLSKLFNGTLELGEYVINDKEFRIPCRSLDSPIVNDDISSCSTGQKCMISMVLSFALLKQSSTKYNIIKFDEIDGGLDQNNRAMFIEVLKEMIDILEVENCIMISHSSEAVLENTDIILLNPVGYEVPKGNIIFTYQD